MNKKVVIVACAIIAFFLGAIWVDYVPVVAPLVAFLELAVGFGAGYLFGKDHLAIQVRGCQDTIQKFMEANLKLTNENNRLKKELQSAEEEVKVTPETSKKAKTSKKKKEVIEA